MDKRFLLIVITSWVFVYMMAIILGSTDYDLAALEAKMRQNYLKEFYQAELIDPADFAEEETGLGMGEEPIRQILLRKRRVLVWARSPLKRSRLMNARNVMRVVHRRLEVRARER
jgi:hypothetical protein